MMPSSFGKHAWIHRCIACLAACAIAFSYVLLNQKVCQMPIISHEQYTSWTSRPSTVEDVKKYALSYYDLLRIYHYIAFSWCIFMIALGIINIIPSHQDLKVCFITIEILIMGCMALFTFYIAFDSFNKPCKSLANKEEYKLGSRLLKDKRPVNAFEDEDEAMLHISAIDATVGFLMLCSTFLYCFDSRQHMIEWRN